MSTGVPKRSPVIGCGARFIHRQRSCTACQSLSPSSSSVEYPRPTTVFAEKLEGAAIHCSSGQKKGCVRIRQPIAGSSRSSSGLECFSFAMVVRIWARL